MVFVKKLLKILPKNILNFIQVIISIWGFFFIIIAIKMLTTLHNDFIDCWNGVPDKRPTIQEIVMKLRKEISIVDLRKEISPNDQKKVFNDYSSEKSLPDLSLN